MLLGAVLDVEPAGLLLLPTVQELRVSRAVLTPLQPSKQDGLQTAVHVANLPCLCIVRQHPDSEAAVLSLLLLLRRLLGELRLMSPVSGVFDCTIASMPSCFGGQQPVMPLCGAGPVRRQSGSRLMPA
jgi:hypothetical protein